MQADLRFYAELKDFLDTAARGSGRVTHGFDDPASVKDVIESHGVPHTEVDLILANGRSVDFSYRLADGDRISVYPVFEALDISPIVRVRPEPLRSVRFVVDVHLSKLARHLRLVGFDTVCVPGCSDHDLVAIATREHRILLTRDVGLLKHSAVTHGCYVRAIDPLQQLVDVVERFQLGGAFEPFTRCLECNGVLEAVDKATIARRLPPRTRALFDDYSRCPGCERVYWQGSHVAALSRVVETAQRAAGLAVLRDGGGHLLPNA